MDRMEQPICWQSQPVWCIYCRPMCANTNLGTRLSKTLQRFKISFLPFLPLSTSFLFHLTAGRFRKLKGFCRQTHDKRRLYLWTHTHTTRGVHPHNKNETNHLPFPLPPLPSRFLPLAFLTVSSPSSTNHFWCTLNPLHPLWTLLLIIQQSHPIFSHFPSCSSLLLLPSHSLCISSDIPLTQLYGSSPGRQSHTRSSHIPNFLHVVNSWLSTPGSKPTSDVAI